MVIRFCADEGAYPTKAVTSCASLGDDGSAIAMCNHYRNNPEALPTWPVYAGYELEPPAEQYAADVWPKRGAMVIRREAARTFTDVMLWGIPRKMRGASGKMLDKRVTNVRNLDSSFWKSTLARPEYRCVVPFSTFAEPRPGKDPETGRPAEWWFRLPASPISSFAGIWRPSEHGNTFAFLTCEPNPLVAPLHPKAMPVILHDEDVERWLTTDYDGACALAVPFPSQLMEVS
jgi:putative SOS response-associated peptidase YedK